MDKLRVADAISEVFTLVQDAAINILMRQCLGHLQKMRQNRIVWQTVLYNLVESINIGAESVKELLPETSAKDPCSVQCTERDFDDLATFGLCENGLKVTDTPEILFARLDLAEVMKKVEELHPAGRQKKQKAKEADSG